MKLTCPCGWSVTRSNESALRLAVTLHNAVSHSGAAPIVEQGES